MCSSTAFKTWFVLPVSFDTCIRFFMAKRSYHSPIVSLSAAGRISSALGEALLLRDEIRFRLDLRGFVSGSLSLELRGYRCSGVRETGEPIILSIPQLRNGAGVSQREH